MVPGQSEGSVHELFWEPIDFKPTEIERLIWNRLFELRQLALPELEQARQAKIIGKALEAKLTLTGSGSVLAEARSHSEALREILNVSQLEFQTSKDDQVTSAVSKADGQKCERCWHWETDVGSHPEHPTICARCVKAVLSTRVESL
jgi:isoleucyl-tRNA synthetase